MTISIIDHYVLGASKVLSFLDEDAFSLQTGAPSAEIRGAVSVLGQQDFQTVHAFSGGLALVDITITETGAVMVQQTGNGSGGVAGEFQASATVTNHGLVEVQSASLTGQGFRFHDGGLFTNSGVLSVAASNGSAIGVSGAHTVNSGLIQAIGREQTVAVEGALDNSGTVRAVATNEVSAVKQTGDLHNTGDIIAHCQQGVAVGVRVELPFAFSFDNQGLIAASGAASTAVLLETTSINPGLVEHMAAQTLENGGLIRGHTAISALGGANAAAVSLDNSGTIRGDILLGDLADAIVNTGKIAGNIRLGGGDDSFSSADGITKGLVVGGLGDDALTGSKLADILFGDETSTDAADGADTLTGGRGGDTLTGGGGADHFVFLTVNDSTAAHSDLITDLQDGDLIDLSQIDADRTIAGDQGFFFVSAFDGRAGEAVLSFDAGLGVTRLQLDVNGDGAADSEVMIAGDHSGFTGFIT